MARLVLDTNSLVQCISQRSPYHELWNSLLDGRNLLCVSTEILDEYAEILDRVTSSVFSKNALGIIVNNPYTIFVTPYFKFNLIQADLDDNKFIDCAVCGNAKFIVTEDHHYRVLQEVDFPKVAVITLDEIMKEL
ncbi:MAG: putative toxin-antitoxin system toxin component, PIN family [Bacteroidaceae bacterium]|nr:putative toxin-antitoxin system toxin component, PIN family [Bacteroidaceae bacterium]